MKKPIYLDYSATTPVDPRVAAKMIPFLTENFGNPASRSHVYGWDTEAAVEEAREQVADLVGADAKEIVFTSGATESINLAVKGAAQFYKDKGKHLITVATEHKATLDTMRELERSGFVLKKARILGRQNRIAHDQRYFGVADHRAPLFTKLTNQNVIGRVNAQRHLRSVINQTIHRG